MVMPPSTHWHCIRLHTGYKIPISPFGIPKRLLCSLHLTIQDQDVHEVSQCTTRRTLSAMLCFLSPRSYITSRAWCTIPGRIHKLIHLGKIFIVQTIRTNGRSRYEIYLIYFSDVYRLLIMAYNLIYTIVLPFFSNDLRVGLRHKKRAWGHGLQVPGCGQKSM